MSALQLKLSHTEFVKRHNKRRKFRGVNYKKRNALNRTIKASAKIPLKFYPQKNV
jgi:hypothetical protein